MAALSVAAALLYTPSQRFLECVHCPKYFVVRRVDYLHYRIERAHYLLRNLAERAVTSGVESPYLATTPYINTIPPELQVRSPGNHEIEAKLRALIRWNATNMDGGGSSIMGLVGGDGRLRVVNSPSDRRFGVSRIRPLPMIFTIREKSDSKRSPVTDTDSTER